MPSTGRLGMLSFLIWEVLLWVSASSPDPAFRFPWPLITDAADENKDKGDDDGGGDETEKVSESGFDGGGKNFCSLTFLF